jgi:hypothetical protein
MRQDIFWIVYFLWNNRINRRQPTVNFRCGESTLPLKEGRMYRTTGTILCFDKYAILARVGVYPISSCHQVWKDSWRRTLVGRLCRVLAATLSPHFTLHIRRHLLDKLSRFSARELAIMRISWFRIRMDSQLIESTKRQWIRSLQLEVVRGQMVDVPSGPPQDVTCGDDFAIWVAL